MDIKNKLLGSFLGLAIGDCVGTTVEFNKRDTFEPITDMIGQGPFNLPAGYWTDDTSMALCLAQSLLEYPDLNKTDLLTRFTNWYHNGENSSTGTCFDIGSTTLSAILNFEETKQTTNNTIYYSAGNGSIMRLAPAFIKHHKDIEKAVSVAVLQSETTHGTYECLYASEMLTRLLYRALQAPSKYYVYDVMTRNSNYNEFVENILEAIYKPRDQIKSSGYVVHTLQAAIWSFHNTDNFKDAILLATNLGDDSDTVAAVTGQIAGMYYGLDNIPTDWVNKLYQKDMFIELGNKLINE
jgi:ADP-ribosyl-[dinitrogen reductase] hydrolase